MRIVEANLGDLPSIERCVLSIGNFDGVHRGHQQILRVGRECSDRLGVPLVALTFEPHPISILSPDPGIERIGTPLQKLIGLESAGADQVIVLPSSMALLSTPADVFIKQLVDRLGPKHFVEGRNFGYGKARAGNVQTLIESGKKYAFEVTVVEPVMQEVSGQLQRVSSSLIRELLLGGDVETAASALGRPFCLDGRVATGAGRGKQLGFATANLSDITQLIPANGVYAGIATLRETAHPAALSIGSNPTFGGIERQVEAHLLDFDADLTGEAISLSFVRRIRDQHRFESVDALCEQISRDVEFVRANISAGALQNVSFTTQVTARETS